MSLVFMNWYRNRSLINWGKVSKSKKANHDKMICPFLKNDITRILWT